jgi:hypothetical protein
MGSLLAGEETGAGAEAGALTSPVATLSSDINCPSYFCRLFMAELVGALLPVGYFLQVLQRIVALHS